MKKIALPLMLFPLLLWAKAPDWVINNGESVDYPDAIYLTGFGMASLEGNQDPGERTNQAVDDARANLIKKVRISLQSHSSLMKSEEQAQYREAFSSLTQASSNLEIAGLETQSYLDRSNKMVYALAFVSRDKLAGNYKTKADRLIGQIKTQYETGKSFEARNDKTKALEAYLACYPLLAQLEETAAVIAGAQTAYDKAFDELDQIARDDIKLSQITEAVNRLAQKPLNNADDLAWYLTFCLKSQVNESALTVMVTPFTYQDSKMGSQFSRYFKGVMENQLTQLAKWRVVPEKPDFTPQTRSVTGERARASGADYLLIGSYWELPGFFKFKVNLTKIAPFQILASAEATIEKDKLASTNLSFKPENFKQALSDQLAFNQNEVTDGGLTLEAWTNKGAENLLYSESERMRVFVRVNLPCYIRFIYHLADGNRTLLLDNYYIDQSKVNTVYQIPQEFECSPPFGAEVLQVLGRTGEKFPALSTRNTNGYDIIQEDLAQVLTKTRGMKVVKSGVLTAESRLVITTMGR